MSDSTSAGSDQARRPQSFGERLKTLRDELWADAVSADIEGCPRLAEDSQALADHIDRFIKPALARNDNDKR